MSPFRGLIMSQGTVRRSLYGIVFWIFCTAFAAVNCEEGTLGHLPGSELPRFVTKGGVLKAVIGETVVLPCQVENLGRYILLWKRGNAVLSAGDMKITVEPRISIIDGSNLEIKKLKTHDAGDYICQMSTLTPQDQVHTLEILVPPSVRSEPNNDLVTITKGDTITLQCRANGNPVPTIRWTRKSNLLPNGEQSVEGNSFTIHSADRHQAGIYICTANNGVGLPVSSSIQVKVQYPPEIEVERSWIHSGEGYEAELACVVHSDPPATVKWYRNTMILDMTDRRLVEERGAKHSLIIRKVHASDFGNYSCEADNKLGRSKKHVELSGRPNRAKFQSDPNGRNRETFNITWTVESFSPILEYRLLYRKSRSNHSHEIPGEWNDVVLPATEFEYYQGNSLSSRPKGMASLASSSSASASSSSSSSSPASIVHVKSYYIKNLEPEAKYEAQVSARNLYGKSALSDLFYFHTRRTDLYPFESSPQQDVLIDAEMRDLGMTAASSPATSVHRSYILLSLLSCSTLFVFQNYFFRNTH